MIPSRDLDCRPIEIWNEKDDYDDWWGMSPQWLHSAEAGILLLFCPKLVFFVIYVNFAKKSTLLGSNIMSEIYKGEANMVIDCDDDPFQLTNSLW